MNIELIRNSEGFEPNKFVLHIGEDNIKYWLDSYLYSNYQKVFWTAPTFFSRGYDISSLERATVEKYVKPWYYFAKCRLKDNGLLTSGLDDSYSSDLDFRMAFGTENIKAIVVDEPANKKEDLKLFLEKSKTTLNLCKPDIIYVRSELEHLFLDYAAQQKMSLAFSFETGMVRTLNQTGTVSCAYSVFLRDKA